MTPADLSAWKARNCSQCGRGYSHEDWHCPIERVLDAVCWGGRQPTREETEMILALPERCEKFTEG